MSVNDIIGFNYDIGFEKGFYIGKVIKKDDKIIVVEDERGKRQFNRREISNIRKY